MNIFSLTFLVFLFFILVLYYLPILKRKNYQNYILLIASSVFYIAFSFQFYILLLVSSLVIYYLMNSNYEKSSKINYVIAICIPIGMLVIFKYLNFFGEQFCLFVGALWGGKVSWTTVHLVLPLGISFYSFKQLCYIIDLKKNKIHNRSIFDYLNYILLFNTITAGPIDRPKCIFEQIQNRRNFNYELVKDGMTQIVWGFFKKIAIADVIALLVDDAWENYDSLSPLLLLFCAFLYSFQIYFDFSGYSDIAIGVGKLIGLRHMQNFRFPYFARTVSEFWRRWHISLTSWFTEYIYIPLGGSYHGRIRKAINTLVVFTVSGLWHGANWTFILWGIYHGLLFIPGIIANKKAAKNDIDKLTLKIMFNIIMIFVLITFGWMLFRAPSLSDFLCYVERIVSCSQMNVSFSAIKKVHCVSIILLVITICIEWKYRLYEYGIQKFSQNSSYKWYFVIPSLLTLIFLFMNVGGGEFIYANF